jgi:hypothetical protein
MFLSLIMVMVNLFLRLVVTPLKKVLLSSLTLILCVNIPLRKTSQKSSLNILRYTLTLVLIPPLLGQMVLDLSLPMRTLQTLPPLVTVVSYIRFLFDLPLFLLNLILHYLSLLLVLLILLTLHNLSSVPLLLSPR